MHIMNKQKYLRIIISVEEEKIFGLVDVRGRGSFTPPKYNKTERLKVTEFPSNLALIARFITQKKTSWA